MGTVEKVNAAMRSVSKGDDMKEDMALMMAPNASWEHFLTPAPLSIALLGELMLISTDSDFSLDRKPPKDGFQLLKWPSSFRACLAQVGHSGWDAFNEAHTNMDQIRHYATNVPTHMKKAVHILLKGSTEELEEMLPIPLGNIKMAADKCLKLATSIEDKFLDVMKLTAELLEACTNAKGHYEKDLRDTESALAVAKQHEAAVKEEKKRADEQYQALKNQVKDSEKQFKESMDSLPNGWEMLGMSVAESIANGFKSMVSMYTFQFLGKTKGNGHEGRAETGPKSQKQPSYQDQSACKIYQHVEQIMIQVGFLVSNLIDKTGKLRPEKLINGSLVLNCKHQFSRISGYIKKEEDGRVKQQAMNLCESAQAICQELEKISGDFHQDQSKADQYAQRILQLDSEANQLAMQGQMLYSSNPLDSKSPNQVVWTPSVGPDDSFVQQTINNARFKIEQASAHLKHTQEKHDKASDRLKESSQKLGEILADIAKFDIQKIDFEKIKETLIKGIKALGEVREQWGKLVLFFQMMSNLIECCLNTSLKNFLQYSTQVQQRSLNGYTISTFSKDMIYQEAFEAAKIANLVTMISGENYFNFRCFTDIDLGKIEISTRLLWNHIQNYLNY